jgi:hypothetical protein
MDSKRLRAEMRERLGEEIDRCRKGKEGQA